MYQQKGYVIWVEIQVIDLKYVARERSRTCVRACVRACVCACVRVYTTGTLLKIRRLNISINSLQLSQVKTGEGSEEEDFSPELERYQKTGNELLNVCRRRICVSALQYHCVTALCL